MSGESSSREPDRREVLVKGAGAVLAAGLAGTFASTAAAAARTPHPREAPRPRSVDDILLETVTGPIRGADVTFAMAHEHLFVDFLGPTDPGVHGCRLDGGHRGQRR